MQLVVAQIHCRSNRVEELSAAIDACLVQGARGVMILACDEDGWRSELVDPLLNRVSVPLFGGSFPKLIIAGEECSQGTVVLGLACEFKTVVLSGLSLSEEAVERQLSGSKAILAGAKTIVALVDGLSRNIESMVDNLYSLVGRGPGVLGGGCGSLSFVQRPVVFTNRGLLADAAVLAAFDVPHSPGVRHGWTLLEGPYLVTDSQANALHELNYLPAYEVYREEVEKHSSTKFDDADFFSIAKTYPIGMQGPDGELVVRDPLRVEGNSLICVGEVPQHTTVYLLEGRIDKLVASAGDAAADAMADYRKRAPDAEGATALIFNCISRCLFMGEEFNRELTALSTELGDGVSAFGALTLGEISSSGSGAINLLNKSTVIGVF